MSPTVRVRQGDATAVKGDVLILKFAQERYGLDALVARGLRARGLSEQAMSPSPGEVALHSSEGVVSADAVLFVGVEPLRDFGYREIRVFARRALSELGSLKPTARHLIITLQGAGFGLDEQEAFESLVAGLVDAVQANQSMTAESLEVIDVVESDARRAERLAGLLDDLLPAGQLWPAEIGPARSAESDERLRAAGYGSGAKPHVFVAMPFTDDMSDHYHYGIQGAVRSAGYLCERADLAAFTGDILERVKERIASAELVVADLTGANPNVYLEVGFAWGKEVPTVLLVDRADELKFDVRGQRCLQYTTIRDLEERLRAELHQLRGQLRSGPSRAGHHRS